MIVFNGDLMFVGKFIGKVFVLRRYNNMNKKWLLILVAAFFEVSWVTGLKHA
jgi:paired small multidrug resistance pump